MSEATLVEENASDLDATDVEASAGPTCEKCGLSSDTAACPRCGWYPSLGIHVEIDESFEAAMNNVPEEPDDEAAAESQVSGLQKHLLVWQGVIPGWAWLMLATTLVVIAAAITARVVTISSPSLQTYIGVGGLITGLALAVLTHVVGFLLCSFEDADFGVFDVVLKPVKTWKKLASELPRRLWLANSLNVGVTTAIAAALIVGGIPYERLLDWGIKASANKSLVAAIAEKAGSVPDNGSDNLEDAMGDFAGKAAADLEASKPTPPVAKPRKPVECLIIGYQKSKAGKLESLLLAAESYGKLRYVGKVRPTLEPDEMGDLQARLNKNRASRSFVKTSESAVWVQPKFPCRATCTEWERGKRPEDIEWKELLEEIRLPW